MNKRKNINFRSGIKKHDLVPVNIFLGLTCIIAQFYLTKEATKTGTSLISIELLALTAGLIIESYRITKNWETLLAKFFSSYLLSLLAFAPAKQEYAYHFAIHVKIWPFFLIFFFVLFTAIANREKVTARLTEGLTLMLSIAAIYRIIDYDLIRFNSVWEVTLVIIVFLFTLTSFIHAFTRIQLSKGARLFLSIWSTIILFAIAYDNIILLFNKQDITYTDNMMNGVSTVIQYFLLGISSVYIMQNFILLYGFLPEKQTKYKDVLQKNIKRHIERFSDKQVSTKDSGICLIYCVCFFTLNYYTNLLSANTMIWLVVFTFPVFLGIFKQTTDNLKYR